VTEGTRAAGTASRVRIGSARHEVEGSIDAEIALDILSHDQFRPCSSSVDDIRSWLVVGGVSRVERMRALGCSDDEINTLLGVVDRWLARMGMAPARDTTGMN
jgi:hypothetical protein